MRSSFRAKRFGALLAAGITMLAMSASARAEFYGLVVGINEYQSDRLRDLHGAVNDANDIRDALMTAGATHVTQLLDSDATRSQIFGAWDDLVSRAKPGDTIVFTYAGHGAQQPERVAGSEEDGRDEMFQLHGFQTDASGNQERILDDELNQLFARTSHLRIVFVADSCHSGTMSRNFDTRAGELSTRGGGYEVIEDDQLPPANAEAAAITEDQLEHVLFFGAVKDSQLVVELPVEQQMRGVMSWAFARALRGAADANKDLVLHGRELEIFLRETVRIVSEGRQLPQMARRARNDEIALILPGGTAPEANEPEIANGNDGNTNGNGNDSQSGISQSGSPESGNPESGNGQQASAPPEGPDSVALHIIGTRSRESLFSQLTDVSPAQEGLAELIWDVGENEIISASGDIVARLAPDSGPEQIQPLIDKWLLLRQLARLAGSEPLSLRFQPYDRQNSLPSEDKTDVSGDVHPEGTTLNFEVNGHEHEHMTVFNLAMDGRVQYLIPVPGDREKAYRGEAFAGETYQFPLVVQGPGPFGAEHLVVLASPSPLPDLHREINRLNETASAGELRDILQQHLAGVTFQAGYVTLFSSPN